MATAARTRSARKQQTRNRILRVAYRQFSKKGLSAARTADIARQARVAHGTVFVHFPTRDELLGEVILDFGLQVTLAMHDLARDGRGVRDVLQAHLDGLQEVEAFYAKLIAERSQLPEEASRALLGIQSAISHHLFEAAQKEMERGAIKRLPMHLLFNTWIGLLHHYLLNRDLFAPGGSVIARHGTDLLDHFMTLLKKT